MATTALLVLDLAAVLDTSKVGADAAKSLEKRWGEAKALPEDKQKKLLAELEQKRAALRKQLLDRARPAVAELAKKKGAAAVLEKGAVLWTEAEDITAQVIARVDAAGALKG